VWFYMNFSHLGCVLNLYYKCVHIIIHFNPNATWLCLDTIFLSLLFNILTNMHVANNNRDAWQHHSQASFQKFV
jgi:hypothetical protein